METFYCTQHGCAFEADEQPDVCPVCNNPQGELDDTRAAHADNAGDELPWTEYTLAELREQAEDWDLTGYSKLSKAELIAVLEQAEADDGEGEA